MNDIERIITGGGMVFKKKASEPKGERKPKMSDFLRGTHGSGAAKMRAGFKLKKLCVIHRRRNKEKINVRWCELIP